MQVTKFSAATLLAMLATATGSLVQAQAPSFVSDPTCKLVTVTDNFKGQTQLDASKWAVQSGSSGAAKFGPNGLSIQLSATGQSYVINSQKSFNRGSFTMMMKGDSAPGFVSTAVVRPPAAIADGGDEIDIVELVGARPSKPELVAWHKATAPGGSAQHIQNGNAGYTAVDMGIDMTTAVHNYTSVWDTDSVKWYYDNKLVYTVNLAATGVQRLTQDMQFKFGPWVSTGSWSGNPDWTAHPNPAMLIESVSITGCQTADLAPSSGSTTSKPASSSSTTTTSAAKTTSTTAGSSTVLSSTKAAGASTTSAAGATTTAGGVSTTATPASSTKAAAVSTSTTVENGTTYVYEISDCTDAATGATPTAGASAGASSAAAATTTPAATTGTAAATGAAGNSTSISDMLSSNSASRNTIGSSVLALAGGLAYLAFF